MASGGLLIAAGTLAVMATIATIGLEIVLCVNAADISSLIGTCGAAAATEAVALIMLAALGLIHMAQHSISSSWARTKFCFVLQLLVCIAAAVTSIVALIFFQQAISIHHNDTLTGSFLIGLAMALASAAVFQFTFISSYFLTYSGVAIRSSSFPSHPSLDRRNKHVKGIRYSQTIPMMAAQETTPVKRKDSVAATHKKISNGPVGYLTATVTQAIRPISSRTKLMAFERRRPISLESGPESTRPRTSADTSFDSWDTSSVHAHNRQVVMELSSPTTVKRALDTIPASPSGSLTSSSPDTLLDSGCLEPPQVLRRKESYSSSLQSQCEANRLTSDSSVNEMHIHPLFRSDSPLPPPAATPGTSVLAAPNAGLVISRRGSLQSLKCLRGGSLPVVRSPLTPQASPDGVKQPRTKDGGEVIVTLRDASDRNERIMTPPIPEWLLSPSMKANLESLKKQQGQEG
ncbi:hypothetical protein E4U41_007537 [Claviceps citrina]|nr:hypothetical protein E4U41_007537 [Claviceps citrina]